LRGTIRDEDTWIAPTVFHLSGFGDLPGRSLESRPDLRLRKAKACVAKIILL